MEKAYKGYLFVHFTGEHENGEQIYFSVSEDGLHWKDLNRNRPVLTSKAGEKGARDPFIIRSAEGDKYYIIATDLRIANGKGWEVAQYSGSRNILIWESEDLVNWAQPRMVEVGLPEAGCVWAPEAIYNDKTGEYLVFWASMVKEAGDNTAKQRIYCSLTKDFITFTKAVKYIEKDNHVIDTTIIKDKEYYYRISKDETTKNITMDKCLDLINGPFTPIASEALDNIFGVEGPAAFPINDSDEWCLMVDQFATNGGYMPLFTKDFASGDFRTLKAEEYHMGANKKRHGSILNLTAEEYEQLIKTYDCVNPVLEGLYADPDMLKVGETYYLYPTSDGFTGWSGTKFKVFSSKDKVNWTDEGVIVDVASEQVPWSVGSAWAPAIAERNGKYYYYFCAKRTDNVSCIGVAVASHPAGPFTVQPEPLITPEVLAAEDISIGQTIDPSIFTEEDGSAYILLGNGGAVIARLNEDMISLVPGTIKELEGAYDFREAIMAVKRNGIYHFTWSCDDTGSENYHVNYGVASSIYGPIEYKYPILTKDADKGILGTGHHIIFKEPDKDEYLIAYHRFCTPLGQHPGEEGYNRETCLDRLAFNDDGFIKPVKVTK